MTPDQCRAEDHIEYQIDSPYPTFKGNAHRGKLVSSKILLSGVLLSLAACAGKLDYTPPQTLPINANNMITVDRSKDQIWSQLIPALSKEFFVINNIDKSSGLVNVSYSGDPERYVDCGNITSYVKNARGERTYSFNGAKAHEDYEAMINGELLYLSRNVNLDGRINIIVGEETVARSTVTVNARYIVNITATVARPSGPPSNGSSAITFNTGGSGQGQQITCRPTGMFEQEILALAK
jgi:hypothetical protein